MLTGEIAALEGAGAAAVAERGAGDKARIDAIGQLTRTLEKLLDLRRLERLAGGRDGGEDEAEARRLRDELMRRLRLLDAKRREGEGASMRPAPQAPAGRGADG